MSEAYVLIPGAARESLYHSLCPRCSGKIKKGDKVQAAMNGKKSWLCHSCVAAIKEKGPTPPPPPQDNLEIERLNDRLATLGIKVIDNAEAFNVSIGSLARQIGELKAKADAIPDVDAKKLEMLAGVAEKSLRAMAKYDERLTAIEKRTPTLLEIKVADRKSVVLEGVQHRVFAKVLRLAVARKPIFLPGPAGCGKTHLAEQVAKALGLEFGFISCSGGMSEGHVNGKLLPTGEGGRFEFIITEFLRRYEGGGVFLLDEMDAADPNVLLVINSAIANGKLALPCRVNNPYAMRHPDFVLIAAANTFGTGADRLYVGRSRLDESTLDRFRIGTVPMDYDADIEKALCPDEEIRTRLTAIRKRVVAGRVERIVSTRFMRDAFDMKQLGMTIDEVEEQLTSGWRADEIRKAKGEAN